MTHPRFLITTALLLALTSGAGQAAEQQGRNRSSAVQPPPRSLIQKLRAFLGLNPPVAVGGSRSADSQTVCLLSPWPKAPVGIAAPVIQAAGPLNEIRLEKGGQLLWQQRASSTQPIEGPIAWPIAPLSPGEELTLRVRPRGASGGDFASYQLRTADAASMKANEARIRSLGSDPKAWITALDGLAAGQAPQAAALLSSGSAPASLREALGCSAPSPQP